MPVDFRRAIGVLALAFLVLLLLLAGAGLAAGWREVGAELTRLSPALLAAMLALSLANYLLRGLRWQLLGHPVGVAPPLHRSLLYYVAGFALTATPGKLGEAVRLWLLRRHHGHAYERTLGMLILDRVSDAVPMLILVALGASAVTGHSASVALLALLVLGPALLLLRPRLLDAAILPAFRVAGRVAARPLVRLRRAVRTLGAFGSPRLLLAACALGLVGWSAEIYAMHLLLIGLDRPLPLPAVAFVFGFAMLVGALPLFPGGVGGTEATMIALLLALGAGPEVAVAATGVIRLVTLGFATLLGLALLPLAIGRRPLAATGPLAAPTR